MQLHIISFLNASAKSLAISTVNDSVSPKSVVGNCVNCNIGTIRTTHTSRYQHEEGFPCSHKKLGDDIYKVYEVSSEDSCDYCGYTRTYNAYEKHVFSSCQGYGGNK